MDQVSILRDIFSVQEPLLFPVSVTAGDANMRVGGFGGLRRR